MSVRMQAGSFLMPSSYEITDIRDVLQGMSWSQEVRLERQLFPSYFLDYLEFQWHSQINSGCNRHSKVYWFFSWIKIYDLCSQHPSLDPTFTSHIDSMMDKHFFFFSCRVEWKLVHTSRLLWLLQFRRSIGLWPPQQNKWVFTKLMLSNRAVVCCFSA